MSRPDPISSTAAFLAADSEVDAEVAGLVFGHELPTEQADLMPRKCLVVSGAGGFGSGGYLPVDRGRLDLRSYGITHEEAMDVALAAHNALKTMRRTVIGDVVLYSADPSGGFLGLREPDTKWPLVLRSYLLLYDERAVA